MKIFLLLIFLLPIHNLWCQFEVTFTAPKLGPGSETLEALLAAEAQTALSAVDDMINTGFSKPLISRSMARALLGSGSGMPFSTYSKSSHVWLSLGARAGVWAEPLDLSWLDTLPEMKLEDDHPVGAGVQPLLVEAGFAFPWLQELGLTLNGGAFEGIILGYSFRSITGGGDIQWKTLSPQSWGSLWKWSGLEVGLGGAWSENSVTTLAQVARITQYFPLDIDGPGPFPAYQVEIWVEPAVDVSLVTQGWQTRAWLSTGLEFVEVIGLTLGGGWVYGEGWTRLGIKSDVILNVEGTVGGLIETPGRLAIAGNLEMARVIQTSPFGFLSLDFSVGGYTLHIPVVYTYPSGLSFTLSFGIQL